MSETDKIFGSMFFVLGSIFGVAAASLVFLRFL